MGQRKWTIDDKLSIAIEGLNGQWGQLNVVSGVKSSRAVAQNKYIKDAYNWPAITP